MAIDALIVDDEALARERIRTLLARHADVRVAGECADGVAAVAAIRRERPRLLFLDVQMPGLDGFGVLAHLRPGEMPLTVFITAFDEHAIRAFDVGAADYVLKPIVPARFALAVERALQRLSDGAPSPGEQLAPVLKQAVEGRWLDRFAVESRGRTVIVPADAVHWLEAAGNYVYLHGEDKRHLLRGSLRVLEFRLDPAAFMRIHRSAIVSLRHIAAVRPGTHGDAAVTLRDGTTLRASRSRARELHARLRG
ncbi:MAG TPA: LytTR family transcriptional regulator DNA-binding domain-containing protein [Longimicrobium sp.]|nr:LytTR family transcriptional regulator DNA-binding domain-containing protein [Longimicrobium sp.]